MRQISHSASTGTTYCLIQASPPGPYRLVAIGQNGEIVDGLWDVSRFAICSDTSDVVISSGESIQISRFDGSFNKIGEIPVAAPFSAIDDSLFVANAGVVREFSINDNLSEGRRIPITGEPDSVLAVNKETVLLGYGNGVHQCDLQSRTVKSVAPGVLVSGNSEFAAVWHGGDKFEVRRTNDWSVQARVNNAPVWNPRDNSRFLVQTEYMELTEFQLEPGKIQENHKWTRLGPNVRCVCWGDKDEVLVGGWDHRIIRCTRTDVHSSQVAGITSVSGSDGGTFLGTASGDCLILKAGQKRSMGLTLPGAVISAIRINSEHYVLVERHFADGHSPSLRVFRLGPCSADLVFSTNCAKVVYAGVVSECLFFVDELGTIYRLKGDFSTADIEAKLKHGAHKVSPWRDGFVALSYYGDISFVDGGLKVVDSQRFASVSPYALCTGDGRIFVGCADGSVFRFREDNIQFQHALAVCSANPVLMTCWGDQVVIGGSDGHLWRVSSKGHKELAHTHRSAIIGFSRVGADLNVFSTDGTHSLLAR